MTFLELLAPARNKDIGIAAIDCGADAVYIAGPAFGARKDASNPIEDIRELCIHAHKFGARIFVTVNTIIYESELESCRRLMLDLQEAGADALIVQDPALLVMAREEKLRIPLHASTQCAIRTPQKAAALEKAGFSRIVPERQLSLDTIKALRQAVNCEIECFVHGALCVSYSGECYLSEKLAGRSANRGACIQACRTRYDLSDASGKVIVKDKALLSLKDLNLINRLEDLADAGVTSFKIEGRLKNASYVKNVVSAYSTALDKLVAKRPQSYARASFGRSTCGFTPQLESTFNRGYTSLFVDGRRGKWASTDAPKSMGEALGRIISVKNIPGSRCEIKVDTPKSLANGDGFAFVKGNSICGFRGDICKGNTIVCKRTEGLSAGLTLYRNISAAFEKEIASAPSVRRIDVSLDLSFGRIDTGGFTVEVSATSADGRKVAINRSFPEAPAAVRLERMEDITRTQLSKISGHYSFSVNTLSTATEENGSACLPLLGAAALNELRRELAAVLDTVPCHQIPLWNSAIKGSPLKVAELYPAGQDYKANIANSLSSSQCSLPESAYELNHPKGVELMRSKYCIRYELGICLRGQGSKAGAENGSLYLTGNGRPLELRFDCKNCEMAVIG